MAGDRETEEENLKELVMTGWSLTPLSLLHPLHPIDPSEDLPRKRKRKEPLNDINI